MTADQDHTKLKPKNIAAMSFAAAAALAALFAFNYGAAMAAKAVSILLSNIR